MDNTTVSENDCRAEKIFRVARNSFSKFQVNLRLLPVMTALRLGRSLLTVFVAQPGDSSAEEVSTYADMGSSSAYNCGQDGCLNTGRWQWLH